MTEITKKHLRSNWNAYARKRKVSKDCKDIFNSLMKRETFIQDAESLGMLESIDNLCLFLEWIAQKKSLVDVRKRFEEDPCKGFDTVRVLWTRLQCAQENRGPHPVH